MSWRRGLSRQARGWALAAVLAAHDWTRRRLTMALVTVTLGLVLSHEVMGRLVFIETSSIRPQWLWRTGRPARSGDYAEFTLPPASRCPRLQSTVTKRLACGPGDYLRRVGLHFHCNHRPLATRQRQTLPTHCQSDATLPDFHFDGVIPPGWAFALGDHPLSYDSRYWGLVPLAATEKLVPLLWND